MYTGSLYIWRSEWVSQSVSVAKIRSDSFQDRAASIGGKSPPSKAVACSSAFGTRSKNCVRMTEDQQKGNKGEEQSWKPT